MYHGVIIEESLEDPAVLEKVRTVSTEVEQVTEKHKTPWVAQWTLHTIEIAEDQADETAKALAEALDAKHAWYADFKNDKVHYIIFRNKVFKIDRTKREEYQAATDHGLTLGIPDYQLDFAPNVVGWER